jgi:16S rRNA (adenine1518-N6/adenine1519-N6)-dimethyltransferase
MLVDTKVLARIVSAADIKKSETVLEAGTGDGILTAELCKRAKEVKSYEIDRALFEKARNELRFDNLELICRDPFELDELDFDVFVSNLPYSRSRDAFEWLATQKFERGIVMVQREFAEKLASSPGDREYRSISALANYCFKITPLMVVGRKSFSPPPLVESSVVKLVPVNMVTRNTINGLNFLFSSRNRKASGVAAKAGISGYENEERRIDQLPAETLAKMADKLK